MKSGLKVSFVFMLICAFLLVSLTSSGVRAGEAFAWQGEATPQAPQFDATSGEQATHGAHIPLTPKAVDSPGGRVLWDLTHGVFPEYQPSGSYSSLVALLNSAGYTVDTTDAGLNNAPLSSYDLVVVNLGSSFDSAYTPVEVAAITGFVSGGGGLLVMCDNTLVPNANINPVAGAFGSTCGVSNSGNTITNLSPHPIFAGVSQIQFGTGGEITAVPPSTEVASDSVGKGVVSIAHHGAGRVVVLGDINLWDNDYIANADNQLFAENVFAWLPGDIVVHPPSFHFSGLPGQVMTSTLSLENLGGEVISWGINTATGGTDAVGVWELYYDWGCTGNPNSALHTMNSDHTFTDNFGGSGTWTQIKNQIVWTYISGTQYSGYIAGVNMAGASVASDGDPGCWEATQATVSSLTLVNGDRTAAGELSSEPGAMVEVAIPGNEGIERVTIDSTTQPAVPGDAPVFDETTGQQATRGVHIPLTPKAADSPGGRVLWDLTHGVFPDYQPSGYYSSLVALLNAAGYTVDTTSAGLDNAPLSTYDVVVVNLGSAHSSAYLPNEVAAIIDYVSNGGGLLVMCDNPITPNANVNPVAGAFGSTCGASNVGDIITDLALHPIFFPSVDRIEFGLGGEVTGNPPSTEVAFDTSGKGVVSVVEHGAGRVVVLGDINLWDNGEIANPDNQLFAENTFAWLATSWLLVSPTSGTLAAGEAFDVGLLVDRRQYVSGEYGLLTLHTGDLDEALIAMPVSLNQFLFLPVAVK